jgi:hypothetical protein
MGIAGSVLRRVVGGFNAGVIALTASPRWGKLLGRSFAVISYTGRRSGRTFSTPVNYRRQGDTVTISVMLPDVKTWWRNFTGDGGPISLQLAGVTRSGHATARRAGPRLVTVTVRLTDHPTD